MKLVVLDADTLGEDLDLSPLGEFGELIVMRQADVREPAALRAALDGAAGAVLNKVKIPAEMIAELPTLRLIAVAATGYDNVPLEACRAHGVAVCNVPGYSTPTVAQLTMAMAFSLATRLPAFSAYVRSGAYSASGMANCLSPVFHDMAGQTFGVVGLGSIGHRVAAIAEAAGMRVVAHRRSGRDGRFECLPLDEVLRQADIVSLHVPLTAETRGLISRERIASMKEGAILINVSRGAVTDEQAVADAILSGHLGGFGCDVYSAEPFPPTHPFAAIADRDNVILTPHMAWGSYEARVRCLGVICDNIRALLSGSRLNRVD